MIIRIEIESTANDDYPTLVMRSCWHSGSNVEIQVGSAIYEVNGKELISAINRCMTDCFGR